MEPTLICLKRLCLRVGMRYRNLYLDIAGAPASRRKSDFPKPSSASPRFQSTYRINGEVKPFAVITATVCIPRPRRSDERGSSTLCYGQPCIQLRRNHNHGKHGSRRNHRQLASPVHEPDRILLVSSDRIFCGESSEPSKLSSPHLRPRLRVLEHIRLFPRSRLQRRERHEHSRQSGG